MFTRSKWLKSLTIASSMLLVAIITMPSYADLPFTCSTGTMCKELRKIANATGITAGATSDTNKEVGEGVIPPLQNIKKNVADNNSIFRQLTNEGMSRKTVFGRMAEILEKVDSDLTDIYVALTSMHLDHLNPWFGNTQAAYENLNSTDKTSSGIEERAAVQQENLAEQLNNFKTYGQFATNDKVPLKARLGVNSPDSTSNYTAITNQTAYRSPIPGIPVSPPTAQNLVGPHTYATDKSGKKMDSATQAKLDQFLQNLSSGGLSNQPLNNSKNKEYVVFQRMLAAIQSVANYNIAKVYADRVPLEPQTSIKDGSSVYSVNSLLDYINTHNPGSADFWSKFMKSDPNDPKSLTLFDRAHMMIVSFFSINYNLNRLIRQQEQTNLELAMLITQVSYSMQWQFNEQNQAKQVTPYRKPL